MAVTPTTVASPSSGLDAEAVEKNPRSLSKLDGVLVPGGFGRRGIEGKIRAVQYVREKGIPYFGLCLGMQVAVIEFARNVAKLPDANSTEFNPKTPNPVIHLMKENKKRRRTGGAQIAWRSAFVRLANGSRTRWRARPTTAPIYANATATATNIITVMTKP